MKLERILVVNAGSSSVKLRVVGAHDETLAERDMASPAQEASAAALTAEIAGLGAVQAVGHRVVHGGSSFRGATVIDIGVLETLEGLRSLDPLHEPGALAGIRAAKLAHPGIPQVACFDTAFHSNMPAAASTYALPAEWIERWGLRRYGFHGLSHAYCARTTAELLDRPLSELRLVSCHLGAGASLAAVQNGQSVDTTMGFTPLEGLVMATRSGSVDPGLLLWLEREQGMSPAELDSALQTRSGLLGLSGTKDMQEVINRSGAGDQWAVLALEVYLHRLRQQIAAMTAAMGGLDALVFTGGVGENAPLVRERAVAGLGFLGLRIDSEGNSSAGDRSRLELSGSSLPILLVAAREDLQVAREVRELLHKRPRAQLKSGATLPAPSPSLG